MEPSPEEEAPEPPLVISSDTESAQNGTSIVNNSSDQAESEPPTQTANTTSNTNGPTTPVVNGNSPVPTPAPTTETNNNTTNNRRVEDLYDIPTGKAEHQVVSGNILTDSMIDYFYLY